LKLRLAATEKMGSTQLKRAPIRIIFPVCGSRGSLAKWKPRGVRFSSASKALRFSSNCQSEHTSECVNSWLPTETKLGTKEICKCYKKSVKFLYVFLAAFYVGLAERKLIVLAELVTAHMTHTTLQPLI
jgi:hypothetical protein